MRITAVEVSPLDLHLQTALTVAYGNYPHLEYALLKLHTDDGQIGLGEAAPDPAVTGETQAGVMAALQRAAAFLVGSDPFDSEPLVTHCLRELAGYPAAIAAIDMALYDLMGQALRVPVHRLLGGKARTAVALYPVIPLDDPATMAAMSRRFVDLGASVLKVKLGSSPEADLARLNMIRHTVGNAVRLRLDINQGWRDAATALATIDRLRGFSIDWIEQPVAAHDLAALAAVTAGVDIPIMADESCHGPEATLQIVCARAADMINIKLMKCGGMRQAARMLAIADAARLPCILGSMGESSIGSAAGLHFIAANPSLVACELLGPLFITNDPATGFQVDMTTFHAIPSDAPGLGVHLQ